MPIYEYQCGSCMMQFALRQSINVQPGQTACPSCSSQSVERLISRFAAKTYGASDADPSGGTSCSSGGTCGSR
jgi:putative FmdB family regulatory protein